MRLEVKAPLQRVPELLGGFADTASGCEIPAGVVTLPQAVPNDEGEGLSVSKASQSSRCSRLRWHKAEIAVPQHLSPSDYDEAYS